MARLESRAATPCARTYGVRTRRSFSPEWERTPLPLKEQVSLGRDGSMVLTLEQPLPSSGGAAGTYPVKLILQRPTQ